MKQFWIILFLLTSANAFGQQADTLAVASDSVNVEDQSKRNYSSDILYNYNPLYFLNDLPSVDSYGATSWQFQNEVFIRGRNNPIFVHEGFALNTAFSSLAYNQFGGEFHFLSPELEAYEVDPVGFGNLNLGLNQGQISTRLKRPDYGQKHAITFNSGFNFEKNGATFGLGDGNSQMNHLSYSLTFPKWGLSAMATNVGQEPILDGTKTNRNSFGVVLEQNLLKGLETTITGYYYKQDGKGRSDLNTLASEQRVLTADLKYQPFDRLLIELRGGIIESNYQKEALLEVDSADLDLSRFLKEYNSLSSQPNKTSYSGKVYYNLINKEQKELTLSGSYEKAKIDVDLHRRTFGYTGINNFNFDALKESGIAYSTFFSQNEFIFSSSFTASDLDTVSSQNQETFGLGLKWETQKFHAEILANLRTYDNDTLQPLDTDQLNLRFDASYLLSSKTSISPAVFSLTLAQFDNFYPINSETGDRVDKTNWIDFSFTKHLVAKRLKLKTSLYRQTAENYPYPFTGDIFVFANNTVTATLDQILDKTSQTGVELQVDWNPIQDLKWFDWKVELTADFSKRTNNLIDDRVGRITTEESYDRKMIRLKNHFKKGPFSMILGVEWNQGRQHYLSFSAPTPGHFQLPLSKDSGSPFASSFLNFFGLDNDQQPILFEAAARDQLLDNDYLIIDRLGISYAHPKPNKFSLRALEFSIVAHKQRMIYNEVPLLNPNVNLFQFPTTLSTISLNMQAVF